MRNFTRKDVMAVVETMLESDQFRRSVRLVGPFKDGRATQKIQCTRQSRSRPRKDDTQRVFILTLGGLNYAQRTLARQNANGKPLVHLQSFPAKKKK